MKRTKTLPPNLRRPLMIPKTSNPSNQSSNNNSPADDTVSLYTYRLHVGTTQTFELTLQNPPSSPLRLLIVMNSNLLEIFFFS